MGFSNTAESGFMLLVFQNTNWANIGDATGLRGSSAAGSLYWALYTADPGEAGTAITNEAAYTGYARVAAARGAGAFPASGTNPTQVANGAAVNWPQCTAGTSPVNHTHWALVTSSAGAGDIVASAPLGTAPKLFTGDVADNIIVPGNTLAVNDPVVFEAVSGLALPTGITQGTVYFVKTVSSNTITISTTVGGSTLDITVAGAGFIYKSNFIPVQNGIQPSAAIGALVVSFD